MRSLAVLRDSAHFAENLLEDWHCIYIQHLLCSNVECVDFLFAAGLCRSRLVVFGKGYSTSPSARAMYDARQVRVFDVASDYNFERPFDERIIDAVVEYFCELRPARAIKLLILDEGGIGARALASTDLQFCKAAIVELTARGAHQFAPIEERARIVDVGRSLAKKTQEAEIIAASMLAFSQIEFSLRGLCIADQAVGVVGVGAIGSRIRQGLVKLSAQVRSFDARNGGTRPSAIVRESAVIFSSTGEGFEWWKYQPNLPRQYYINAESSDVEFNIARYRGREAHGSIEIEMPGEPWRGAVIIEDAGCERFFLRGGFPINFDGSPDPIPIEAIQLTRGLLMAGAIQAVLGQARGVHELAPEFQNLVLKACVSEG